ncbi:hypothetical protein CLG96_13885 [Sphingomonas oleivorans]|uniref:DUF3618 domain-containing protein n=1 Tax=Sphingomonas oleivorans TaxID=1735121 RepID=A0A2T5FWN1_9SPHN|nr:DUF3618 domain-containing protein [Sphingomonas oleivorans]PTQ10201.1 hypothetical protein CLG96_13885 [Sphingomonas oleivorans]
MNDNDSKALRARAEADSARTRLAGTLHEIQQRLKPGTLAANAWDSLRDSGTTLAGETVGLVRKRPLATAGLVAGVAAFFARKPLLRLLSNRRAIATGDDSLPAETLPGRSHGMQHIGDRS